MDSSYMTADRGPALKACVIVVIIISVLAVVLRFMSRCLISSNGVRQRLWWDDWLALAALPFVLAHFSLELAKIHFGYGKHISTLTYYQIDKVIELNYCEYYIYNASHAVAKASVLMFYRRVFSATDRWFTWALWIIMGANVVWFLGMLIDDSLHVCDARLSTSQSLPCSSHPSYGVIGGTAGSTAIDLLLLILPMPLLWKLQMRKVQKIQISLVFFLGYGAIFVSVGRLITVAKSLDGIDADFTWVGARISIWYAVEIPLLLLCACLPAMLNLARRIWNEGFSRLSSLASSAWKTTRSNMSGRHGSESEADMRLGSVSGSETKKSLEAGNLVPPLPAAHAWTYRRDGGLYQANAEACPSESDISRKEDGRTAILVNDEFSVKSSTLK